MQHIGALILAAGKGTRMHSPRPKVLAPLLGEPMLWYVYEALSPLFGASLWTVVGYRADLVRQAFPEQADRFVLQAEQLGTGHAVQVAWERLEAAGLDYVLVVNGDTPLVNAETVKGFAEEAVAARADMAFLSLTLDEPGAFGRVVRDPSGAVSAIVEAKDYDAALHGAPTGEINAGIYCLKLETCGKLLEKLSNDNKSGEYYLTDLVALATADALAVAGLNRGYDSQLLGVNSPLECVAAENLLREALVELWLERGVFVHAPGQARIGPRVRLAPGVELTGPVELYGETTVAAGVVVESHCVLTDAAVEADATIRNFSHLEKAHVGPGCVVGPYARLRPGAVLEEDARVGNFVEMKKATLGKGAKANHLSYLGDATVGEGANIGAGTITCNYDGKNKHATRIGAGAFIGSNTALVAPVCVGEGALVGAGSVITEDVAPHTLALARCRQKAVRTVEDRPGKS